MRSLCVKVKAAKIYIAFTLNGFVLTTRSKTLVLRNAFPVLLKFHACSDASFLSPLQAKILRELDNTKIILYECLKRKFPLWFLKFPFSFRDNTKISILVPGCQTYTDKHSIIL